MRRGNKGRAAHKDIGAKWCVQNHGHMAKGVAKRLTSTIEKRERSASRKDIERRFLDRQDLGR